MFGLGSDGSSVDTLNDTFLSAAGTDSSRGMILQEDGQVLIKTLTAFLTTDTESNTLLHSSHCFHSRCDQEKKGGSRGARKSQGA